MPRGIPNNIIDKRTGNRIKTRVLIADSVDNYMLPSSWVSKKCAYNKCNNLICGSKYDVSIRTYCSNNCEIADRHTQTHETKHCIICGKEFTTTKRRKNAKYCSPKCKGIGYSLNASKKVICINCGKEFRVSPSRNRKYCSQVCRYEYEKTHNVLKFSNARGRLRQLGRFVKCERCGYDKHPEILGVHHIDNNHSNNALENLIVLCPNCHSLMHKKHIVQGGISHAIKTR